MKYNKRWWVRLTKRRVLLSADTSHARPDRQIEIGRSDANYYNPDLYSDGSAAAVGPGGVFRSSCIAKYIISGPVVPIYEAGFLSQAIVPAARTYTSGYIYRRLSDVHTSLQATRKGVGIARGNVRTKNPIRPNDTEGTIVECTTDRENQEV